MRFSTLHLHVFVYLENWERALNIHDRLWDTCCLTYAPFRLKD